MEEIWRPVSVCNVRRSDGSWKYEVSNLGHVRVSPFMGKVGREVKQRVRSDGFVVVKLEDYGTRKRVEFRVHHLVAEAFIPNPENRTIVSHKDWDLTNNRADNLVWGKLTRRKVHGVVESPYGKGAIRRYTMKGEFLSEHDCVNSACFKLGLKSPSLIFACCRRQRLEYKGFIFRFVADDEFEENNIEAIQSYRNRFYKMRSE